jgi:hypothetical protein
MSWYLDSIRIFVQKFSRNNNQIVARLQPLNANTIHHIFGRESEIINVDGLVVGNNDYLTLKNMAMDGNLHTFTGNYGISFSDVIVKSVKGELQPIICQTIRPDLPETAPVYNVSLELYRDE